MTLLADTYQVASGKGIYGGMAAPAPESAFLSLTSTDYSGIPNSSYNGRPFVFLLHGSGVVSTNTGRQYQAQVDGYMAFPGYEAFAFSYLGNQAANGVYYPTIRPHDNWFNGDGSRSEARHSGFLRSDGRVHLIQERRADALLAWAEQEYTQFDHKKRICCGGSMGGWGAVTYGMRRYSKFAALYPDRPRWRYGYNVGKVALSNWGGAWTEVDYANSPLLADEDGGGSYAVYNDAIAHISDPSNKLRWIGWCIGRQDGYATWQDQLDAVAALRATGRAFAFYWNNGDHSTGSKMVEIVKSYPYGTFEIGKGWPLFTEHSLDKDPAVDLIGGINIGLSFRNVVETAGGWSCEVTSVTGACTVKVKPVSEVFTANVAAKTVTIPAANTWVLVNFTA